MGRSSRLAIGAIAAAVAAGQVAPSHLGAAVALGARGGPARSREARPRLGARALLPVAGRSRRSIAIRLAVVPAGPAPLDVPPDGDGPWTLVVEVDRLAARRTADRDARARRPTPRSGVHGRGDAAALSGRRSRAIASSSTARSGRAPTRPTARTSSGSVRSGRSTSRTLGDRAGARRPRPAPRGAAARRGRGARPRPARARGRTRRRDPDRPARPGRSRPRGGVHDGRRQPRRRDLRLEHRDRRGGHRRDDRTAGAPPSVGRDDRRDRRLRRVRRCVAVGRARGADGRRRPAGARERPRGTRDRGPRLGRDAAARHRPEPHRRRRLPAVVAGDGRPHRLGDAADRMDRARSAAAASRAGWPRASASRSRRRPRRCRSSSSRSAGWRSCRRSSTSSSSRSSRRRWPPASSRWRAACARRSPGRRRSSGPSSPRPAG